MAPPRSHGTDLQLSVVVPLYNEQENVAALHAALHDALDPLERSYELILVDDGSRDSTFEKASELVANDSRLTVVRFRRNFGQTAAMAAGIEHARGEVIVTMDGDLQNDPRDIPLLLDKLHEGYDLVAGWRVQRQDKFLSRKLPSRVANWLIGKVTGIPIRDNGCSLKAYRASVIKRVPLYSDMHRFIPAMSATVGARITELPVRHHPRTFGKSKYGLSRFYKVLLDLCAIRAVVGYSAQPIAWFATLALPFVVIAAALIVIATVAPGFALPLWGSALILLFAVGFLVPLGILSELIQRVSPGNELGALTTSSHWKPSDGRNTAEVGSGR